MKPCPQVAGTGSALPATPIGNDELFRALGIDKPGSWLTERFGIQTRRLDLDLATMQPIDGLSDTALAEQACWRALEDAGPIVREPRPMDVAPTASVLVETGDGVGTTEHTINDALAEALKHRRRAWAVPGAVRSEPTGAFAGSAKRPDILIAEPDTPPVVVEMEVLPAVNVEQEAQARLGQRLRDTDDVLLAAIALRVPERFRKLDGDALRAEAEQAADLSFALYAREGSQDIRWPQQGWLTGGVRELATVIEYASVPPTAIEQAADVFTSGINAAAACLASCGAGTIEKICDALRQEDSEQTRRMAMTIVANALIFQERLAGGSGDLKTVRTLAEVRADSGRMEGQAVLGEWAKILHVNYSPLFHTANRIVQVLPSGVASRALEALASTATNLLENRLARSHDLTGAVFQKLIADRKFLAAFYTMPSSAVLLTNLALDPNGPRTDVGWEDADAIGRMRVADFACGTGTLLSAAYHRIAQLHERASGDSSAIHERMMVSVLVGCDILPAAAHLTASMLAGVHPSQQYDDTSIHTLQYGLKPNGDVALGSLDLLAAQRTLSMLATPSKVAAGKGEKEADSWLQLQDESCDLVIMNPPFTRATGEHGVGDVAAPIPVFASFGADAALQRRMADALKRLTRGTSAHGNAGQASAFLVLADAKTRIDGRLALVMPLSILAGDAWAKSRELLRRSYSDLVIVTIAGGRPHELSFSADTGMGECLIVGTKSQTRSERAKFVVLRRRPGHPLEAFETARAIRDAGKSETLARLEDGPVGGSDLAIGKDVMGSVLDAPLPEETGWPLARIADFQIAQTAYQLAHHSRLWLPSMHEAKATPIPITRLGALAAFGPLHRDINGREPNGRFRGPFDVVPLGEGAPTYPMLWAHDADRERTLVVPPDSQGRVRRGQTADEDHALRERLAAVWATASHAHQNFDFQFNSQSLAAAYTDELAIGGRAWPSVKFATPDLERAFVVWANSTLGLLLYWWIANKQQAGRGSITISTLPDLPTLDLPKLDKARINAAVRIFSDMKELELRPVNEIDRDLVRHELDRRVVVEVLGLDAALAGDDGPLQLLRRKLSREPTVYGGKRPVQP